MSQDFLGETLYCVGLHYAEHVLIYCGNPLYIPALLKAHYFYCPKLGLFYMVALTCSLDFSKHDRL